MTNFIDLKIIHVFFVKFMLKFFIKNEIIYKIIYFSYKYFIFLILFKAFKDTLSLIFNNKF